MTSRRQALSRPPVISRFIKSAPLMRKHALHVLRAFGHGK
jgi:hypothetical protein